MTKRLYHDDSYLTSFNAYVLDRRVDEVGPRVALNQTAFYPEGGGQPSDRGTLNGTVVTDVQTIDGIVWHRVEKQIMQKGVRGEIDWDRRLDHMQQHHGQHLLSAAFENLFGYATTSFHLGVQRVTIDLAVATVTDEEIKRAEREANRIVWENREIHARFVSPEELGTLDLRKQPTVDGPIRVVSVPDFDHSPCGGTHPRATGTVGIVYVSKAERRGDETRIEFACGKRVLEHAHAHETIIRNLASMFTVGSHELEDAVSRLRDTELNTRRQFQQAKKELQHFELGDLMQSAGKTGNLPIVAKRFDGRPLGEIQSLAQEIAALGGIAVFATAADKAQIVVARPDSVDLDCSSVLRSALAAAGGGGGGRPALASGGLPDPAKLDRVMEAVATDIRGILDRRI